MLNCGTRDVVFTQLCFFFRFSGVWHTGGSANAQLLSPRTAGQLVASYASPSFGLRREKTCFRWFANNKGADQPARPRSLISAFVVRVFETIIPRLASIAISILWLVSVAEEAGLNLILSETPNTDFLATRPIYNPYSNTW